MSRQTTSIPTQLGALFGAILTCGPACAGGIPDPPPFNYSVPTANADYQVQSVDTPASPHYFPPLKTIAAALALDNSSTPTFGNPNGYHAGYINRGFRQPYFSSGDRLVQFYDCALNEPGNFGCDNGFATVGRILMPVSVYAPKSNACIRAVIGHELFHHIEFAYADAAGASGCGGWMGTTACEGQARALQDKIYLDLDLDPEASCVASYLGQVNNFLESPNQNLWASGYDAALWWTYLTEQFGAGGTEPHRGIDFLRNWWQNAEAAGAFPDALAITDTTIKQFRPEYSAKAAFHDFTIANIAKDLDLTGVSAAFRNRYSYRDEEPLFPFDNQMQYDQVPRSNLVVPANGERELDYTVSNFGTTYASWDVSNCAAGSTIRFETDPSLTILGTTYYTITGLLVVRGTDPGVPVLIYKNRSTGWSTELVQPFNRYSRLLSAVSGWSTFSFGNLRVSCEPRPVAPQLPLLNPIHPLTPGPGDTLTLGEIPVEVYDPATPRDRGLRALAADQFSVSVGDQPATVLAAIQRDASYRLQVRLPSVAVGGNYPLTVRVGDRSTTLADAVTYGPVNAQLLLAIDTSTSMLQPTIDSRLAAVRRASLMLTDSLPPSTRLGLIEHFGNNIEPDTDAIIRVPLGVLDAAQRGRMQTAIAALNSGSNRFSAFGDALRIAIGEFDARAEPRQRRAVILIADGPENDADRWNDIADATIAAGITVHTVALGALADQPLLARIARETGGEFRYVDVGASVDSAALGQVLAELGDNSVRRQRIAHQSDIVLLATAPTTLRFQVPATSSAVESGQLVIDLFGAGGGPDSLASVRVFDPLGVERLDGVDGTTIRRRARMFTVIDRSQAGEWRIEATGTAGLGAIAHSLVASVEERGNTLVRAQVRRDADDPASIDDFLTGDEVVVQIGLLLPAVQKVREAAARIRFSDGALRLVALNDDGERGDALAGDNVWSGRVRRTTFASPTGFPDSPSATGARGSIRGEVEAILEPAAGSSATSARLYRNVHFPVLDTGTLADADGDLLPDRYEQRRGCLNPAAADGSLDADRDTRGNLLEYQDGTDPCDADSDAGGEDDDSERRNGRRPDDPSDDLLCPIEVAQRESPESEHEEFEPPGTNAIKVRFSTCARNTQIELRRSSSPNGPFVTAAMIDPLVHRGVYLYQDLIVPGPQYFQLLARNGTATGAPSAVFSAPAKLDPERPIGSVIVNAGGPRSDDPQVSVEVSLYNKPAASTQMRVRLGNQAPGPWLPYARTLNIATPAPATPTDLRVVVELRDSEQDVSAPMIDDLRLYPRAALGDVTAIVAAPSGGPALGGVLVQLLDQDTEANAIALTGQVVTLRDLKPGNYVVAFDGPGGTSARRNVVVVAGATLDLGTVVLATQADTLFGDGFESP